MKVKIKYMTGLGRAGSPLPAVGPNAVCGAHGVTRPTGQQFCTRAISWFDLK